jgi:ribosomal protein L32
MAVPKKRSSRSRRDKRRYALNKQLVAPGVYYCSEKNDWALPHRFETLDDIDAYIKQKAKAKQKKKK